MSGFQIEEGKVNYIIFGDYQLVLMIHWSLDSWPSFHTFRYSPAAIQRLVERVRHWQIHGLIVKTTVVGFWESKVWQDFCQRLVEFYPAPALGRAVLAMVKLQRMEAELDPDASKSGILVPIHYSFVEVDEEKLDEEFPDREDFMEPPEDAYIDVRKIVRQRRR